MTAKHLQRQVQVRLQKLISCGNVRMKDNGKGKGQPGRSLRFASRGGRLVDSGWGFAGLYFFEEPDGADAGDAEDGEPTEDVDEGPVEGLLA